MTSPAFELSAAPLPSCNEHELLLPARLCNKAGCQQHRTHNLLFISREITSVNVIADIITSHHDSSPLAPAKAVFLALNPAK
jgi:hypothetical protein